MDKPDATVPELLRQIIRIRNEMVRDVGADDFAVPAPSLGRQAVDGASAHLACPFPASYREFLLHADGVRDFADEIDLFGAAELVGTPYRQLAAEVRDLGWRLGERVLVDGLLIGGRAGYRNVFMIDLTVEPDAMNERPVVYWSDVTHLRAPSFREFLLKWCGVAEQLHVLEREKAREQPAGAIVPRAPGHD